MVTDDDEIELGVISGVGEVIVQATLAIRDGGMAVHVAPVDVVLGLGRDGEQDCQRKQQKSDYSIQHWADFGEWCLRVVNIPSGRSSRPLSGPRRSPLVRCSNVWGEFTMLVLRMQDGSHA